MRIALAMIAGACIATWVLTVPCFAQSSPPSGYTLQETITVPGGGQSVQSRYKLLCGIRYFIRASGTLIIGGGDGLGDAEYHWFDDPRFPTMDNCEDNPSLADLGIGINDDLLSPRKFPFWGSYMPADNHVYTIEMAGTGDHISLNYHDCYPWDNSGSLQVEVFAPYVGPRDPQVTFDGASLQGFFNSSGQGLNVYADQWNNQCWTTTVSHNSTFTIEMELAGIASANTVGIYDTGLSTPVRCTIFPATARPGWLAVASFDGGTRGRVVVNLFDEHAVYQYQEVYADINSATLGFYLEGPGGTFYSEDGRNGCQPQMLTYPGTGTSFGQWWLAFESVPYSPSGSDFDDFVMFMESVYPIPVPAQVTSWGSMKAAFGDK